MPVFEKTAHKYSHLTTEHTRVRDSLIKLKCRYSIKGTRS